MELLSLPSAEELASMPAVAPVTLSLLAVSCRAVVPRMHHTYHVLYIPQDYLPHTLQQPAQLLQMPVARFT